MYKELAVWWPLLSPVTEYQEEVAFFLPLLEGVTKCPPVTMLELGSGGGNNAFYMKSAFKSVTLVDLSAEMLEASQQINPDCEHLQGDMRTVRLDRTFDAVFVHDAIDYMTTLDDLKKAMETAFVHCKAGGMALFVPDAVRETFEASTDHGGEDGAAGQGVRYLEWTYDPDENDSTYITDYVVIFREAGLPVMVEHDQHILGLFSDADWLRLLDEVGFEGHFVVDPYNRHVFVAHKG